MGEVINAGELSPELSSHGSPLAQRLIIGSRDRNVTGLTAV